ncbi:MAG: carbonic anhydrase [Pirellulaceae bacterium]|nr:carbonic anhydrase [Pirellulaceae bacterium]
MLSTTSENAAADEPTKQPAAAIASKESAKKGPSAQKILNELLAGNERFVAGNSKHPHESATWRNKLEASQKPKAVILGCADSRVPPEIVFDQGLGDLFVIRVAGNIVDSDVIASVEYAVDHLDTPLVVVLGHTHCGAVTAAYDMHQHPRETDEIKSLLYRIKPSFYGVDKSADRETQINQGVHRNVERSVRRLKQVPDLMKSLIEEHDLRIVGAVYDLHTGKVDLTRKPKAKQAAAIAEKK